MKESELVFTNDGSDPRLANGAAEPAIIKLDDQWYLFWSGNLGDDERKTINVARSSGPFGPWEVHDTPLLTPSNGTFDHCAAFAPTLLLEGTTLHMWYLGNDDCLGSCPDCNFALCGCEPRYQIGYAHADITAMTSASGAPPASLDVLLFAPVVSFWSLA